MTVSYVQSAISKEIFSLMLLSLFVMSFNSKVLSSFSFTSKSNFGIRNTRAVEATGRWAQRLISRATVSQSSPWPLFIACSALRCHVDLPGEGTLQTAAPYPRCLGSSLPAWTSKTFREWVQAVQTLQAIQESLLVFSFQLLLCTEAQNSGHDVTGYHSNEIFPVLCFLAHRKLLKNK